VRSLRIPVRWPILLLAASIGFTALGLVEANRAIRSQRTVAEHALHDYAGFVSWSYEQHLREVLAAATQEVLGAVNHGSEMHSNPRIPRARELAHYLPFNPKCGCHRPRFGPSPEIFFGFQLGTDTLGSGVNTHPDPTEGWEVDRPLPIAATSARRVAYSAVERRWINDTLTRQIRAEGEHGRFPIVIAAHDSIARILVYTLMPTSWGDTMVYGAEYSQAAIRGVLADVMYDRNLLPQTFTRGKSPREVVQLQVRDAKGSLVFESEPVREWAFDDSTRLPTDFGGLLVRAQIRPEMAGTVVIGGLPRSRLPFLLGLLAVSAALALVALGQIRREGELARLRENFVANISHELRTPLAQMRLYLETLRLGRFTTDDQRAWSLDNVERETTRLAQLVERVLRFSRTGRPDDDAREKVDAASEVQRIVEEFRPLAAARGARVTVDARPVPPLVLRPAALRHIVLNLLDNAVKYGPAGQTVHVDVGVAEADVRIAIEDEGPGIPPADRVKVWKPYQRGRTAGHTAGSGIGLAVVRDVAIAHGGRAWIEERASGRGASFVITLPVAPGPREVGASRPVSTPQPIAG
jgi:signal transduction histidine kinase